MLALYCEKRVYEDTYPCLLEFRSRSIWIVHEILGNIPECGTEGSTALLQGQSLVGVLDLYILSV